MDERTTKCAGIDWAKDYHALCLIDGDGRKVLEGRFAHEEGGIAELCRELVGMGVERVAIERPEGVLVERLLEAGGGGVGGPPQQPKAPRPPLSATPAQGQREA